MNNQNISKYIDPKVFEIKIEIEELEKELNEYINQKSELEKILSEFSHLHTVKLGTVILEILKLRQSKFKFDEEKYKEATFDKEKYEEEFSEQQNIDIFKLNDAQKKELKTSFRKAVILCHPDKVQEKFKNISESIFIELKSAYDINDLKTVNSLLKDLQNNDYTRDSKNYNEIDILELEKSNLLRKVKQLLDELNIIKKSETYIKIISISDWEEYFTNQKKLLNKELEILKSEQE